MYHTDNTSLRWFESYLHDRTQRCCINGSLSDALPITRGVPQGSILGPILFFLHINDLPLAIPDCNVDIYADDTTLWMANSNPLHIQLQGNLNKANHWFLLNKMVPNAKKTKQLLLGTKQKLSYCTNPSLNLSLRGTEIEEVVNEKLLGVKIDKHLNWNSHIDYMITKLNSRVNLLKRPRKYLNLSLRNLQYNTLIKPIFEYCCSVWGNTKIDNLQRLPIIQKCCARVILNASTERSVGHFKRLGWIPISDIIEQRKLCIMHNIIHGKCPDYFNHYICYVKNRHRYTTWASTNMDLSTPFFSTMTGKRSFLASNTKIME